ncbi:MAG: carboxypeptidase regulatory-like domain-containing protein [Thermoanaerobaculales bacterium]|nr:carboxypeptidase regulatory-like domain-containing protein [Thermoanaerobaculales bacterium]
MKKLALLFFATTMMFGPLTWAGPQARLAGVVTDTSGKPITTAVITITTDEQPSFKKVLDVDEEGGFKTLILDATKQYLFTVEAPGFETLLQGFKISVGSSDRENFFDFKMKSSNEMAAQKKVNLLEQPGYKELDAGRKLMKIDQLPEAREQFETALQAIPTLLPAMESLADVLLRLGEFEAALATARSCLEEDDESQACLAVAANASHELGDIDGYNEYMARYQQLNPEDPATLFNQAVVFLNKMDDENARPLIEKCLQVDPEFPECLFEYGMILLRSGDIEGSKANLQKYIEVAPDGPEAITAAETVKYL